MLLLGLALSALAPAVFGQLSPAQARNASSACAAIAKSISSASSVYYPLLQPVQYAIDIAHYGNNNAFPSVCSVEPGTAADVGVVLTTVGKYSVPFGVKSGGHCLNAGCSSSYGIQINMNRFHQVTFNPASKTVLVGIGQTWDGVYSGMQPTGYTANGGRVSGVGVGGFTLGGGYSWRTNQYGLTCDTLKSAEIVLPSGVVANTSDPKYSDLLFGLRGGFQNFGIVTNMEFNAVPDGTNGMVWGGLAQYSPTSTDAIFKACSDFDLYNTDVKASVLCNYFLLADAVLSPQMIFFYDAATLPSPSPFANFTSVLPIVNTTKSQKFSDFVAGVPSNVSNGMRGLYHSTSVFKISPAIITAVEKLSATLLTPDVLATGTLATITLGPSPLRILERRADRPADRAVHHPGRLLPLDQRRLPSPADPSEVLLQPTNVALEYPDLSHRSGGPHTPTPAPRW